MHGLLAMSTRTLLVLGLSTIYLGNLTTFSSIRIFSKSIRRHILLQIFISPPPLLIYNCEGHGTGASSHTHTSQLKKYSVPNYEQTQETT